MSADNWGTCPRCKKKESLREDYEIGIEEIVEGPQFYVHYGCRCDCGFEHSFNFTRMVLIERPAIDLGLEKSESAVVA